MVGKAMPPRSDRLLVEPGAYPRTEERASLLRSFLSFLECVMALDVEIVQFLVDGGIRQETAVGFAHHLDDHHPSGIGVYRLTIALRALKTRLYIEHTRTEQMYQRQIVELEARLKDRSSNFWESRS
jgi:hypothetical protein